MIAKMKKFYTQKTYEIELSSNFLPNIFTTVNIISNFFESI